MKVQRLTVETSFEEYNTDTSAGHPIKDDDIVRTILKNIELQNKKSVR